ncbi:hypothetical protein Tco_0588575 [Tanacetum coccineum]
MSVSCPKRRLSCPNNSCISEGAKRYGDYATGVAPGAKSMRNSTCRCRGNPDKSSGNTSLNSRTTDMSFNFGSSSFALFSALAIPTARSPRTLMILPSRGSKTHSPTSPFHYSGKTLQPSMP